MHKALQIKNKIVSDLEPLISSGTIKEILVNESVTPSKHPCVTVSIGSDIPVQETPQFLDSLLTVYTDITLLDITQDLDSTMLSIRTEIHKIIYKNLNLGLDFVLKVTPAGQEGPENSSQGDDYSSETRVSWAIRYRSLYTDPSM